MKKILFLVLLFLILLVGCEKPKMEDLDIVDLGNGQYYVSSSVYTNREMAIEIAKSGYRVVAMGRNDIVFEKADEK